MILYDVMTVIQYYVGIVSYKEDIMKTPIVMIVENFQFIKTNTIILQANFAPGMTGNSQLFIIKLSRFPIFYYIMKQYKAPPHVLHHRQIVVPSFV